MVLPDVLAMLEATGPRPGIFLSISCLASNTFTLDQSSQCPLWVPCPFPSFCQLGVSRGPLHTPSCLQPLQWMSSQFFLQPTLTFPKASPNIHSHTNLCFQLSCRPSPPDPGPSLIAWSSTSRLYPSFQEPKTLSIQGTPPLSTTISSLSPGLPQSLGLTI